MHAQQALRLLNNLMVDGNLLLVKVDKSTQALLDADAAAAAAAAASATATTPGLEEGEQPERPGDKVGRAFPLELQFYPIDFKGAQGVP
jgi:hypothetical protein